MTRKAERILIFLLEKANVAMHKPKRATPAMAPNGTTAAEKDYFL